MIGTPTRAQVVEFGVETVVESGAPSSAQMVGSFDVDTSFPA